MNARKILALLLILSLCLSFAGCSQEGQVYVQSVQTLMNLGGIAPGDRFLGMVVSENVSEINKDSEKSVKELLVTEGQDVKEGQALFSYDTEELQLTLDKQLLELEQLKTSIENYEKQIKQLEREREGLGPTGKLQYTIQIQTTQLDLKEAQLNLKTKESEVDKSQNLLENATVVSPVQGRVQSISENSSDNYGNPLPYITIQKVGSYRVKGILGEQQRGGLREGDRVQILSRTPSDMTWAGEITLVDYENPSQGSENDRYYGTSSDEMAASSKYPFYVKLDSTDGLILGQHVYLELEQEEDTAPGIQIGSSFLCYNDDGTPYVWAESRGKLAKRDVTLGQYNDLRDTFEILEGLTPEDYIAFPDPALCVEGAPTTHDQPEQETEAPAEEPGIDTGDL